MGEYKPKFGNPHAFAKRRKARPKFLAERWVSNRWIVEKRFRNQAEGEQYVKERNNKPFRLQLIRKDITRTMLVRGESKFEPNF